MQCVPEVKQQKQNCHSQQKTSMTFSAMLIFNTDNS